MYLKSTLSPMRIDCRPMRVECASTRVHIGSIVMRIELKHECISHAFVIGSGTLTGALVSYVVQPAAISNAKYRKKARQQLRPLIKLKRQCVSPTFVIGSGKLTRALISSVVHPAAISNTNYRKKVRHQLRPHKKRVQAEPCVVPHPL